MRYTNRQDFPELLPSTKVQYCWHCRATNVDKAGMDPVTYECKTCGKSSSRVLIYDPNMQMHFRDSGDLVHESCGVLVTRSDGKLLLFKRTKFPYLLTIPAGHLEVGEDPRTCAIRETEEEIGVHTHELVKVFEGDIVGDSCLGGADIHYWHAYAARVAATVQVRLDGEGSSWGWYDASELTNENTVHPVMFLLQSKTVVRKLANL